MIEPMLDARPVRDALSEQLERFRSKLEAAIQRKLAGEVLRTRSGALAASIISSIENSHSKSIVAISSSGLPYAAIQEFGGKTKAHEILAVNSKALTFRAGGDLVFAKNVSHPGSTLPARSYLRSSLNDIRNELRPTLKQAIVDALAQNASTA